MTDYLLEQRNKFYHELYKIMKRIASDSDKIEEIKPKLDQLLDLAFDIGFDVGSEYQYKHGYDDGYGDAKNELCW